MAGQGVSRESPPPLEGLAVLLDGYFHQDFRAEHGSHQAAAHAFARDASPGELEAARRALAAFIAWASAVDRTTWQEALLGAGGAWRPRSLGPVRAVLAALDSSA